MIIDFIDNDGSLNFRKPNFDFAAGCSFSPSGLSSSSTAACFGLAAMNDPRFATLGGTACDVVFGGTPRLRDPARPPEIEGRSVWLTDTFLRPGPGIFCRVR